MNASPASEYTDARPSARRRRESKPPVEVRMAHDHHDLVGLVGTLPQARIDQLRSDAVALEPRRNGHRRKRSRRNRRARRLNADRAEEDVTGRHAVRKRHQRNDRPP